MIDESIIMFWYMYPDHQHVCKLNFGGKIREMEGLWETLLLFESFFFFQKKGYNFDEFLKLFKTCPSSIIFWSSHKFRVLWNFACTSNRKKTYHPFPFPQSLSLSSLKLSKRPLVTLLFKKKLNSKASNQSSNSGLPLVKKKK